MIIRSLIFAVLILTSLGVRGQHDKKAQQHQQKEARYQQLQALVESGQYVFSGRFALPQKGRQVDLSSRPNYLRIKGREAEASLPYFGVAYNSSGYGSGGGAGINFTGVTEGYKVEENKKKYRLMVSFRVRGERESYTCRLIISGAENALLSVTGTNRQPISYKGSIAALTDDKD